MKISSNGHLPGRGGNWHTRICNIAVNNNETDHGTDRIERRNSDCLVGVTNHTGVIKSSRREVHAASVANIVLDKEGFEAN